METRFFCRNLDHKLMTPFFKHGLRSAVEHRMFHDGISFLLRDCPVQGSRQSNMSAPMVGAHT
jgi:hypothetical protein